MSSIDVAIDIKMKIHKLEMELTQIVMSEDFIREAWMRRALRIDWTKLMRQNKRDRE